jgi:hypothetical protein
MTKVGPELPDEKASRVAADHAETATADFSSSVSSEGPAKEEGYSERS